jgi:hypothetical protein
LQAAEKEMTFDGMQLVEYATVDGCKTRPTSFVCMYSLRVISLFIAFIVHTAPISSAQAQAGDEPAAWAPLVRPEIFIDRADGLIRIDGRLDDEGWRNAQRIESFAEIEPGENIAPPVRTVAWVTYDDENLYVAFKAYDNPSQVRASLRNRDEIFQDDWVGIILDPYGDAVRAYELFANPLGIQGDLLMTRSGENIGFDMIYHTAGQITEEGFVVEMAIPFKSLRFPQADVHDWRITFLRNYPRTSRHILSWAAVDRNDSCLMCQLGTIRGLEGVRSGGSLEVLPALVGTQASHAAIEPGLDHGRISLEPSVNLRYNISSSLAAEATINPDFSQVESDASQIDVNSTFALYFPERRPFFQEGSEMFDTMIDVVYTRSINSPSAAVKLTGQPGRTSVGIISAVDERSPMLLPFQDRSALVEAGRSVSNIIRGRHTFGANSHIGAIVSDRRYMLGGSGTEAGVDGQWQISDHVRVMGQFVQSHTLEPDRPEHYDSDRYFDGGSRSARLDGERFSGQAGFIRAGRYGRSWNLQGTFQSYSPTFRAANGFVSRNDYRRLGVNPSLAFYPNRFVEQIRASGFASHQRGYDGELLRQDQEISVFLRMKRQSNAYASFMHTEENFRGERFRGLWWMNAELSSQFNEAISIGAYHGLGRSIARFGSVPEAGSAREMSAWATIKPLQRLVIRPRVQYASMTSVKTGEELFSGYILRTRADLLFTKEFSLRLVAEYNDFAEAFSIEPLLSYRMNAYSIVYIGSTQRLEDFGDPYGFNTSARQFFFKMQYLFRT